MSWWQWWRWQIRQHLLCVSCLAQIHPGTHGSPWSAEELDAVPFPLTARSGGEGVVVVVVVVNSDLFPTDA